MEEIIERHACQRWAPAEIRGLIDAVDQALLDRHLPWVHFELRRAGQLSAHCSIWAEATPQYLDERVGVIGHYAAANVDSGAAVIRHATAQLKSRGFRKIVGPMDGNTWRRYRLVTFRGAEPMFFLEPDNPDEWPSHFNEAGFSPLSRYFSAVNDDLSVTDRRVPEALARFQMGGVRIRSINVNCFDEELKAIHELSLAAFAGNFLYTAISQDEFLAMYAPIRAHLRPELVLLAEQDRKLIGFIFGVPDLAQASRGKVIDTVIAKSMAVLPGRSGAGLGSVLMDLFQQASRKLGYTRVIHALMHEANRSRKISSRFGKAIREYTLFGQGFS